MCGWASHLHATPSNYYSFNMSDLHDLCRFSSRPIGPETVEKVRYYLSSGIPATYTVEEAYNYTHGIEQDAESTTTPLHLIATHLPEDATAAELETVGDIVAALLEYGAGWCLTDVNNDTPGCILIRRGFKATPIYEQIVDAGVRAELLLRKVSEYDMEVLSEDEWPAEMEKEEVNDEEKEEKEEKEKEEEEKEEKEEKTEEEEKEEEEEVNEEKEDEEKKDEEKKDEEKEKLDPSHNQHAYLNTKLEYKDGALVTEENQDGVMMDWETDLMRLGCESLFKGASSDLEVNILNIGFGMGIIDTMINAKNPTKHYICEAHPDVLRKLKEDGWYEKPNVVILEGRWQEQLDALLSAGNVYFNGIYYDTFSEHYQDMLELFDYVVGLLKPHGVFSFFNGLGADRQVIYEVYKKLVEIDLANYGLRCDFIEVEVPQETMKKGDASVWDGIRRPYWLCPTFYHPEARFIDV